MKTIASFTINHKKLLPGLYVSRKDNVGENVLTTFDIRITRPNYEPALNTADIHTIEHVGATFLRNHEMYKDKIIYFGPMGCRTGFYFIINGDYTSAEILPLIKETFEFVANFKDDVPGATAMECGNHLDINLPMANYVAKKYVKEVLDVIDEKRLNYPE